MERLDMPAKNAVALIVSVVLFTVAVWFAAPSGSPGPDAPLSSSQKQEIESLIGRYLRENPTVIVEAIQNLQRRERQNRDRRAAQNLVRYRQQLINNPSTPFVGKIDASITVVEFFDYRCPYCKKMLSAVERLLKDDADVRYVVIASPNAPEANFMDDFGVLQPVKNQIMTSYLEFCDAIYRMC